MFRGTVATFILILVSGNTVLSRTANPLYPSGRIIGGQPTSIEAHPWQASLQVLGFHVCGGSIISRNYILTAGHCSSYRVNWMSARVASSTLHSGGVVHRVDEVILHEDYKVDPNGILRNDVAVLRLRTPIEFTQSAQPVPLFHQDEEAPGGELSTISGWGKLEATGIISTVLHTVDVPIVTKVDCNEAYRDDFGGIPEGQICAAYPDGGRDSCQGDSGGPLVISGRQAGIVSWGNGCAIKGYPGVYTEIAYFRDWIDEHVDQV